MFKIRKSIEIDAGHRVPFHDSKCHNIHGHRYRVTAIVGAEETIAPDAGSSDSGMILDFGILKRILMEEIHDVYDHKLILWEHDPIVDGITKILDSGGLVAVPIIPTAEELARFWAGAIEDRLHSQGTDLWLEALEVRETPSSFALYELE